MPALAVATKLRQRGVEVHWIGSADGLEANLVPEAGFELHSIQIKGLRQSGIKRKLIMPFMLIQACFQALIIFLKHRPDAVLGMGGFVSGPGGLVAALLRKPLVVHEQNAVAGLTNRGLSRFTVQVLSGFPIAKGIDEVEWVGNPVRREILEIPAPSERLKGRDGPLRILVFGGSQGAQVFNVQLPGLLYQAQRRGVEVLHQCGQGNLKSVQDAYRHTGIEARIEEFVDDMAAAYAWSDIVICRAGAMTVSEVCAAGAVAIFVPYPYAVNDHQTVNASYLAKAGAAMSLSQSKFVAGKWTKKLSALDKDRSQLLKIASKAHAMAKPDAANRVADICEGLVHA